MKSFARRGGPKGATGPASMHLPPYVYQLFQSRQALEFKPPIAKANHKKPVNGIGKYVNVFEKETKPRENVEVLTTEEKKGKEEERKDEESSGGTGREEESL